jgi:hypothetical protein
MMALSAQTIADAIDELPLQDQLWLMERLAQHIRKQTSGMSFMTPQQLLDMAQDPELQREMQAIEADFAATESDGLDDDA